MRIWRISNHADLSGHGGMVSAGRWNLVKTPIVYCADHPSTALLEMLVHVDAEDLPETYQLLEIDVPAAASIAGPSLGDRWREDLAATRQIGTDFVRAGAHAIMKVPSVIVPFASNFLLNPGLLKRDGIGLVGATRHPVHTRLLG